MSDSKVKPTPPKITPTRRAHAARPDGDGPQGTGVEQPDNALATSIGGLNQRIEPYTKPIAIGVIALVVGGIAVTLYQSEQTGARSDATLSLIRAVDAGDPELLDGVADSYPDTVAAGWASVFRGDTLLATGLDDLFRDRESAAEQIEEAKDAYRDGLSVVGDRVLVARAYLGLAKIAEAEGDVEAAVEAYEQVAANAESDEMREFAEQRVAFLQTDGSRDFVAWFAEQDFAPADPSLPPSLPGLPDLPDLPDLDLPKLEIPGGENSTIDASGDVGMSLPPQDDTAESTPVESSAAESTSAEGSGTDAETQPVVETAGGEASGGGDDAAADDSP